MKSKLFVALGLIVFLPGIALADMAPPSKYTTLYFTQNGQPVEKSVDYEIKCYGQTFNHMMDVASDLTEVSNYSGICQSYGCEFGSSGLFAVYSTDMKYCDISGKLGEQKFIVEDFIGPDMSGLNCERASYDIYDGQYLKQTPEYDQCMDKIDREYYPDGENFICHQSLMAVPESECAGYGYIIKDGQCYQFTDATYECIDDKSQAENECRKLLDDVTDKLAKDENGYAYDEICEIKIDIPAKSNLNQGQSNENNNFPANAGDNSVKRSWLEKIYDFFRCFWSGLFGHTCKKP